MIRRYCDLCERELDEITTPSGASVKDRLGAKLHRNGFALEVYVVPILEGVANDGEVCKYCIIDAVNTRDDRAKDGRQP